MLMVTLRKFAVKLVIIFSVILIVYIEELIAEETMREKKRNIGVDKS